MVWLPDGGLCLWYFDEVGSEKGVDSVDSSQTNDTMESNGNHLATQSLTVEPTPDSHPGLYTKLRGNQGYRHVNTGQVWTKDRLHKDHWDVSDRTGKKVKEVDLNGRRIWPGGPKNKNKTPR